MSSTKKLALSAVLVALGTVFMVLGAVIEIMDLTVCALASLIVVFIYIEIGHPYTWLVWLATSLATALMFPGSLIWIEYLLVFGVYPLIKAYIERLPRPLWWPIKLAFINAIIWALFFIAEWLLGVPFIEGETLPLKIAAYVLMNVAFVAYDLFITIMVRLYFEKIRNRIKRFLK